MIPRNDSELGLTQQKQKACIFTVEEVLQLRTTILECENKADIFIAYN